jgi:polysaccharide biosynthesis/export protein
MAPSSLVARIAAVAAIWAFAGCGSDTVRAQGVEPAPQRQAAAQPQGEASAPPQGQGVSPDYQIGPGDALSVFVWGNPDLSTEVAVRPDGKISIPLVDDLQVVGKTPTQLASDIEAALGKFVRSPDVTVIITSFGIGAYDNQIRIVGAGAVRPQSIPFRQGLTLLDVMIEVGLAEFAAGDRAKLVRRSGDETEEIGVRLNKLVNRGDLRQNLTLEPGDVLIIPESRF